MPKVSVVIGAYNCGKFIQETVRSVISQTFKDWELIIVDDGSCDDTHDRIKEISDERIRVIRLGKNSGRPAVSRNIGIRDSKGDFIALLDHDDIWLPQKLEKQVRFMEQHKDIALLYSKCFIQKSGKIMDVAPKNAKAGHIFNDLFLSYNMVPCSTAMMRPKDRSKPYLFNEDVSLATVEDYDLWLSIAHEAKAAFIDEPLAIYRINPRGASSAYGIYQFFEKTRLIIKKYSPLVPRRLLWRKYISYYIIFSFNMFVVVLKRFKKMFSYSLNNNSSLRHPDRVDRDESGGLGKIYDERYNNDYMESWPAEQKERIMELIKDLNLPRTGAALDYGCGNGIFTNVIKHALPGWAVCGTDISAVAIENAKKNYHDCEFFLSGPGRRVEKKFDFLFSHHVLEHVHDLSGAWNEMNGCMKEKASMFHVLPCGNKGSLEHKICLLRKDGIDRKRSNRYFFEDGHHLRRLTNEDVNVFALFHGFRVDAEYYSNQYHGAVDWITQMNFGLILKMTSLNNANDIAAAVRLIYLRAWFLSIKSARKLIRPFDKYLRRQSALEWQRLKKDKNGSEMYLFYTRSIV